MKIIRISLSHRLSDDTLDSRLGQLACSLAGIAIVPVAGVALIRHPGSRADFLLGIGLAGLLGLLCMMLGMLCRRSTGWRDKVTLRSRWPEFVSYLGCIGLLIAGVWSLSDLGLAPVEVVLGLLLIGSLSLAVLVAGMMSTHIRSLKE
jgi:hypothetical protein